MSDISTVREILENSTTILDKNWVAGDWFLMELPEGVTENDFGDYIDVVTGEPVGDVQHVMTGVCLAGGVLYSLGYTNEMNIDAANVRPVIEMIFDALVNDVFKPVDTDRLDPWQMRHDDPRFQMGGWCEYRSAVDLQTALDAYLAGDDIDPVMVERKQKDVYDAKVNTIVNWNDDVKRKKDEVLDVLRTATKFAIERDV